MLTTSTHRMSFQCMAVQQANTGSCSTHPDFPMANWLNSICLKDWFMVLQHRTIMLDMVQFYSAPHRGTKTEATRLSTFNYFNKTQSFCLLSSTSKSVVTKCRFVMYRVCSCEVLSCSVKSPSHVSGRHDMQLQRIRD